MRPFDFMVPFWGRRYRDYFVDLLLPSLLAPNNLPLLDATDGHRFLIATPAEDWEAIRDLPIMAAVKPYIEPTWIKIDLLPRLPPAREYDNYVAVVRQQNEAQKLLVAAAGARRGYGSLTSPDVIYSDGAVATLLRLARGGYQGAFLPAMRQTEEAAIEELTTRGYLRAGERLSLTAQPLNVPQRVAADIAARQLHPEMALFDQRLPQKAFPVPLRYWRFDGGLLLRSFFGCPVLIDYAAMPEDHAACLENGVLENVYASTNFQRVDRVYIVADSDEFTVLSVTPRATNWATPGGLAHSRWWLPGYTQMLSLRRSVQSFAANDPMRRKIFLTPVRWHSRDIGWRWRWHEFRIACMLRLAVGDFMNGEFSKDVHPLERLDAFLANPAHYTSKVRERIRSGRNRLYRGTIHLYHAMIHIARRARRLAYRITSLAYGDASARQWLRWRIGVAVGRLRGRTDHPPAPGLRDGGQQFTSS